MRKVQVVVVAYGAADLLDRCLRSVGDRHPVWVVDNSSSAQVLAVSEVHGARYTDSGSNRGFGAGVNLALRELLDGPPVDVLLLNPDAELPVGGVDGLASALHRPGEETTGAIAPRLVGDGGAAQRVMWPFPHPLRAWLQAVGLGRLNRAEDFAIGAVLLLRWEALPEVGLFDERFFLYAEETDWQRRARALGWRAGATDAVEARHHGAATSTDPRRREAMFHAGAETYVRKWFGGAGWQVYRAAMVAGSLPRAVVLPGERRAGARQRLGLYLRGPRRAAGWGAG